MQRTTAVRADRNTAGEKANDDAFNSSMSGNGKILAFSSVATNLVDEPIEAETVFLREMP